MPPLFLRRCRDDRMRAFRDRCMALVWALGVLAALLTAAQAGPYEDALVHFTTDSFTDTTEGINGVAAQRQSAGRDRDQGPAGRPAVFSASTKGVFYKDASDKLFNAATGEAVTGTPPGDLAPVRLNNRLRGLVAAALGSLTLMSPDPARRLDGRPGGLQVARPERARRPSTRPSRRRSDARVKQAMIEARAAIVLYSDSASEADKLEAIAWSASAAIRTRSGCSAACRSIRRRRSGKPPPMPSRRSRTASRCGPRCRTPGTAFRSARSCCSPPSGSPSRSASWASSTWRTARW